MNVLSLFSGAGGMDLGLERAGHTIVGLCEIDKHACRVLRRHWPDTPLSGDVSTFDTEGWRGNVDIVAGGSPCQDISVVGRRTGLNGHQSSLFWHQCRIADGVAAPFVVWENVASALTSHRGTDFAAVLWGITGALPDVPDGGKWRNAGICVGPKRTAVWRVLDAESFGTPQRRRRLFVVGGPRTHSPVTLLADATSDHRDRTENGLVTFYSTSGKYDTLRHGAALTLKKVSTLCVAGDGIPPRRMTPVEHERLMTWPDDWTRWADDGKEIPHTYRIQMCGNGVVSAVAEWVGHRITEAAT